MLPGKTTDWPSDLTPRGLVAMIMMVALVAALFGAEPLENWAADTFPESESGTIRGITSAWHETAGQAGLNIPYKALRAAIRQAEGSHF